MNDLIIDKLKEIKELQNLIKLSGLIEQKWFQWIFIAYDNFKRWCLQGTKETVP